MRHIPLRICAGCGRVFDEIQPQDGQPRWMDAHAYLMKYGFHWEGLDRMDDACPPCARVFAIARGRVHPEMMQAATVSWKEANIRGDHVCFWAATLPQTMQV